MEKAILYNERENAKDDATAGRGGNQTGLCRESTIEMLCTCHSFDDLKNRRNELLNGIGGPTDGSKKYGVLYTATADMLDEAIENYDEEKYQKIRDETREYNIETLCRSSLETLKNRRNELLNGIGGPTDESEKYETLYTATADMLDEAIENYDEIRSRMKSEKTKKLFYEKIFKNSRLYNEAPALLLQNTELGREICILEIIAEMMQGGESRAEDIFDVFLMYIKETAEQHCTEEEGIRLAESLRLAISSFGASGTVRILDHMEWNGGCGHGCDREYYSFIECYRIVKRRGMKDAWLFGTD